MVYLNFQYLQVYIKTVKNKFCYKLELNLFQSKLIQTCMCKITEPYVHQDTNMLVVKRSPYRLVGFKGCCIEYYTCMSSVYETLKFYENLHFYKHDCEVVGDKSSTLFLYVHTKKTVINI